MSFSARPVTTFGILPEGTTCLHEPPEVTGHSHGTLEASMVLSIETEYLHPDAGHVKIEDTIVVTPGKYEGLGDIERDWCTVPDG
jgi:Xaa-Pro aminopeptidase